MDRDYMVRSAFQNPCCDLSHGKSKVIGNVLGSLEAEFEKGMYVCVWLLRERENAEREGEVVSKDVLQ